MQDTRSTFGIKLSNIPIINLRTEFVNNYLLLSDKTFRDNFKQHSEPIQTPYLIWMDWPEKLLTFLLQKSILGIESYLPGAVFRELGSRGDLIKNMKYIKNPFSIKKVKGTANIYYNALPALVNENYSLRNCDEKTWTEVNAFYKEIRNPIFHGYQIEKTQPDEVFELFKLMARGKG